MNVKHIYESPTYPISCNIHINIQADNLI